MAPKKVAKVFQCPSPLKSHQPTLSDKKLTVHHYATRKLKTYVRMRFNVDGRPNRMNKVAFSNLSGLGYVHTNPDKFENETLFIRLNRPFVHTKTHESETI